MNLVGYLALARATPGHNAELGRVAKIDMFALVVLAVGGLAFLVG